MESAEFDRRIYKRELKELTGWGDTWIRELERRGTIPKGRVDEGGKRLWWPASEVRAMLAGRKPGSATGSVAGQGRARIVPRHAKG